jgi:hypothetical protein
MNRTRLVMAACLSFTLIPGLIRIEPARAQAPKTAYPSMAPLDQYLMPDRNAEIALARSAAPVAISGDAKILVSDATATKPQWKERMVLYVLWSEGGCLLLTLRSFGTPSFGARSVFNPPAVRSVLTTTYKRTEMVLAGRTKAEIIEGNRAAFEKGELPPLESGAMSYMMSKEAYLTDNDDHNLAHLMFYAPPLEGKAWGADCRNHR